MEREQPKSCRLTYYPIGEKLVLGEVLICDKRVFTYGLELCGKDEKKDSKRRNSESAAAESGADNIARAVRRARRKVYDLIVSNSDLNCFITCTLSGKDFERNDTKTFVCKLNKWLDNLVQRSGFKYVLVCEYHKRNKALHFHALCNADALRLQDSGTVLRPSGGKPVRLATAARQGYKPTELRTVYNVTNWKYGFSTAIYTDDNRGAVANYVSKYITKGADKIGGRYYRHGGDLKTPHYVFCDRFVDELGEIVAAELGDNAAGSVYKFDVENYCSFIGWKNRNLQFKESKEGEAGES